MTVDIHTHVWETPDQLGQADLGDPTAETARQAGKRGGRTRTVFRRIPPADTELHWQASRPVDRAIVLGFASRLLRAEVPNDFVAHYVDRHPEKLLGFAGIDPTSGKGVQELRRCNDDLGLCGVVVSPSNSAYHPADSRAMALYAEAELRQMPVLFHIGGHLAERSQLEYARPTLIDEVARTFPNLHIIISKMGHPWAAETCMLLAKHPRVWSDISGMLARPWQAYNALLCAHEHGVIDKLMFGSDFPYANAADTIEALFSINLLTQGTSLPTVPRPALRGIVERDALALLGLLT